MARDNAYSSKAKYQDIKYNLEAVKFHAEKYEAGIRSPLTLACYQAIYIMKLKEEELNDRNKG